jgi:hypothetical protein
MAVTLLDVNVLLALLWRPHVHHSMAQKWFSENESAGWATCPMTQASFVRIVSNPAFSKDAPHPSQATALLEASVRTPHHRFWIDEPGFADATRPFKGRISGHQQVTDAYLLGLAIHHKGRLATFDGGVVHLLPERERKSGLVVHLSAQTQ